jgi:Icc-related predicted phosphoesterase
MIINDYQLNSASRVLHLGSRVSSLFLFLFLFLFPNFTSAQVHRIVVISDLNNAYGAVDYEPEVLATIDKIIHEWKPQLVICGGDMVAGQRPSLTDARVDSMWMAFDVFVAKPLRDAGIPFAFTIGNHDGSGYPNHARDRAFASNYWNNPKHTPDLAFIDKGDFPFWYSYRSGPVFFASWDASTEAIPEENMHWLDEQLRTDVATGATHRIVLGHLPLYGVAIGRDTKGNVIANADSIRSWLEDRGVDLYVSGHHHAWYPGRHTYLNLLNAGAIGSGPRSLLDGSAPRKTVTVIDMSTDGSNWTETTYDAATWEIIDPSTLPAKLETMSGKIIRRLD